MAKKLLFRKPAVVDIPSDFDGKMTFLGANAVEGFHFNSPTDFRWSETDGIRYHWLQEGESDFFHGGTVGDAGDTTMAAFQGGQTHYDFLGFSPTLGNADCATLIGPDRLGFVKVEDGNLHMTVQSKSWEGGAGNLKVAFAVTPSATHYFGPGGDLGTDMWIQYRVKYGANAFDTYLIGGGGWKQLIIQGELQLGFVPHMIPDYGTPGCPLGAASCPDGNQMLLNAYFYFGTTIEMDQTVRGCPSNSPFQPPEHPTYTAPTCYLVPADEWQEVTIHVEHRRSASNVSTSGAGSKLLHWPGGRFIDPDPFGRDVWIEGGTNFVPGFYEIDVNHASNDGENCMLIESPTPSGAGSGGLMWYSHDNNSLFELYTNGELTIQYEEARQAWGEHNGKSSPGINNINFSFYNTGKDETQVHPDIDVFYDYAIIAKSRIPMVGD